MEYNEFLRRAEDNKARHLAGRGAQNWGLLSYSEKGERRLEHMPTYTYYRRPLQDKATGKPYFMAGIHELGDEDNAGPAPSVEGGIG